MLFRGRIAKNVEDRKSGMPNMFCVMGHGVNYVTGWPVCVKHIYHMRSFPVSLLLTDINTYILLYFILKH